MAQPPLEIDVTALKSMMDEGKEHFLLDVREKGEYAVAKMPGSQLIPLGSLPQRVNELPKDRYIVVHCHHGGRSLRATQWLRQNGFANVSNLAGGIDDWSVRIDKNVPRY